MLFNSYIFILFFLPLTLSLYFGLNHIQREREAKAVLILMSLWFYAYFHPGYLAIILLSVVANFGVSRLLLWEKLGGRKKKLALLAGILGNLLAIFYYKYFNFTLDNVNRLFHTSFALRNILMPLGISFFTFQQISYLVDSYRGETKEYGFLDYALFVTFFPQLVAGPIVTHAEMMPQFQDSKRKKFDQYYMAQGLYWFAVGLGKKVLLADVIGAAADWGYLHAESLSAAGTWVLSFLYMFQIYFDFSGYCDMACGIASMFHLELPINFNSPYKADSVLDFWKRWHMSLNRFLRKYIYFPLGGNKKGRLRTWGNILTVFLISGLWHGAAWTYVLWGGLHGIANVLNHIFDKIWRKIPKVLRWMSTFLFLDLTWIVFRSPSLKECGILFGNILEGKKGGIPGELSDFFNVIEFTYIEDHVQPLKNAVSLIPHFHMWVVLLISLLIVVLGKNCHESRFKPTFGKALWSVLLIVWSVISLSKVSIFLYFNF